MQLMISFLLSHPAREVAVIDTTGSFDVLRFHEALCLRLCGLVDDKSVEEEAATVLDKLKILRAFDFTGLSEAIKELEESLSSLAAASEEQNKKNEPCPVQKPVRVEIPDSEDEEDEMILPPKPGLGKSDDEGKKNEVVLRTVGMIVIDNLTTAMNPLLKKNQIECRRLTVKGSGFLTVYSTSATHRLHAEAQ